MKRLKAIIFTALLLAALAIAAHGAGSSTTTQSNDGAFGRLYTWSWTADASGDVSGVGLIQAVDGCIVGVDFHPGAATDAWVPTDNYDVTLLDADGRDVLYGVGADLSNDDADGDNYRIPYNENGGSIFLRSEKLTPVVANAGNATKGIIRLFTRPDCMGGGGGSMFAASAAELKIVAQDFTANWADLGGEIDCRSYQKIGLWLTVDQNDSNGLSVRALAKRAAAGSDEYGLPLYSGSVTDSVVHDDVFDLGTKADHKLLLTVDCDNIVPYVQFQIKAATVGSTAAQIDAAYYTLGGSGR